MASPVFVLGGYQTDFARNFTREGKEIADLCSETVQGALAAASVDAKDVEVAHVGNFVAEVFCGQGHLGGLFIEADPAFEGIPTMRHEAACAAGGAAILAAMADLEAGRYDVACVLGVELMRNMPGYASQKKLAAAGWVRETEGLEYPWPSLFSELYAEYELRYGLDRSHLAALGKQAFDNAKKNPSAQTRGWSFDDDAFGDDDAKNPIIAGKIRKQDCSQVTDGGAALLLVSARYAEKYAQKHGTSLDRLARIKGFGHRTGRMTFADKLPASRGGDVVLPHVRGTIDDAFRRAGMAGASEIDAIETHDCFTITAYMAIDHFGVTAPGQSFRAIEDGSVALGGRIPLNPSGGLIGGGHPIGATGVRMVLDAQKQVTGGAGDLQVEGAKNVATLNLGGSATTSIAFVVGTGA